jgi:hypothetical protein
MSLCFLCIVTIILIMDFLAAMPFWGGSQHTYHHPMMMAQRRPIPSDMQQQQPPPQQQPPQHGDEDAYVPSAEDTPSSSSSSVAPAPAAAAGGASSIYSDSSKPTIAQPDIADFSSKVRLPTVAVINDAFSTLIDFSLAKLLPPKLENPLGALSPKMREQVDSINVNLEHNIRELFLATDPNPQNRAEITDIQAALVSIVSRNDAYLLTPEQQKIDRDHLTTQAMTRISKSILRFYPYLLQTIRALLAYDARFKNEMFVTANQPAAIIYREWMRVLGYLQSIHAVIMFAAKQQLISLDAYPMHLSDFSKYTQTEVETLRAQILDVKDRLSHLQSKDIEREKKLNEVNAAYNGLDSETSRLNSVLEAMQQKLADFTDPSRLARGNVIRMQQSHAGV